MKIEQSQVSKYLISEIKNLDPVQVYVEDFGSGKGQITIKCWNSVYSYFWGSTGRDTIIEFFLSCDKYYLLGKFIGGNSDEFNVEGTINNIKHQVLQFRREDYVNKKDMRDYWGFAIYELGAISSLHELECWAQEYGEIGDIEVLQEWWELITNSPSQEALTLRDRIIPIVQEALKNPHR